MTQAKHTPGPWRHDHNGAGDAETFCMNVYPVIGNFEYRGDICYIQSKDIEDGISTHESEANARLIAAAPTYHDGAEAFIAYEEAMERGDDIEAMLHYAEATRLLRFAMKQATGA